MQKGRLKVEEKELDFVFEVVNVQFNQLGRYALVLTVENPLQAESNPGVKLRIDDGEAVLTGSVRTDAVEQASLDDICTCAHSTFVFTLPKGFCKNDKNHDVRLKVEALRLTDSEDCCAKKAGEGFFAIYPRTNAPRINLYADRGEELYRYSGVMALLRVRNDNLSMHCGRLVYTAAFHEARPFLRETGSSTLTPSLPGGHPSEGEVSPRPPNLHRVPTVTVESAQQHQSTAVSVTRELTSLEPQTPQVEHTTSHPEPDSEREPSAESPSSTPRNGASLSPELSSQKPVPGAPPTLGYTPAQTPEPVPYKHVIESPGERGPGLGPWLQVSSPGSEVISVVLHGATGLPSLSTGATPLPFAIVKSGGDEARGRRSRGGVTRCAQQPTTCPCWGERLSVELQEQEAPGEAVVLSVADGGTKELLAHYRLPVGLLRPFHHYHLELVQAHSSAPSGVSLYASVVRQVSALPREAHFFFTGLEVVLQAMDTPLKEPAGPLFAAARVVPDYHSYRDAMLLRTPRAAGVAVTTVRFPRPPDSTFHPSLLSAHGRPQVSQAGSPEERPVWNHSFLFLERDCATMFSGAAALVLEYYPTHTVLEAVGWRPRGPLGFSVLPLQMPLYRTMMSQLGQGGVRLEKLSLRGSGLQTAADTPPSVSIALRLIGSERPDSLLLTAEPDSLVRLAPETLEEEEPSQPPLPPHTEQHEEEETSSIPAPPSPDHHTRPLLSLQREDYSFPSYDALAQILPDYQHLFTSAKPPAPSAAHPGQQRPSGNPPPTQSSKPGPPLPDFENDPHIAEIADLQTQEVENYRTAMRKMAEDIVALRSQMVHLESDNSRLRSDLSLHQDLGRQLLDDTDIDVMTKAEIADRIASLKFKLASETSKAGAQREKIQQLQNELIRKNDREKELLRLQKAQRQQQDAQRQQQEVVQSHQGRVAHLGLEATVKQQKKVIEKMEKVLDNKLREKNQRSSDRKQTVKNETGGEDDNRRTEMESVLAAENCRLRGELEKTRHLPAPIIIQQQPAQEVFPDRERLSLLSQLEKAEARIQTLETQLEENSRRWGRQKQEMLTRLSEQNHGFTRTTNTILHNIPMERCRQLKPVK